MELHTARTVAQMREKREEMHSSLLRTIDFLVKAKRNPKLAEKYDLTEEKIGMFFMFHGINYEKKAYSIEEIAGRYQTTHNYVVDCVEDAAKAIRKIDELQEIKENLHNM